MPSPLPSRRRFLQHLLTGFTASAAWRWVGEAFGQISAVILPLPPAKPLPAPTLWAGAVTAGSARVKAWIPQAGPARLIVTASADPQQRMIFDEQPFIGASNGVRNFHVGGLDPDTAYEYAVEHLGLTRALPPGRLRTFPSGAASFTFAFSSCARTGSSHEVFKTIAKKNPHLFIHLGDLHYSNIDKNDARLFRAAWHTTLTSPAQAALYRSVPLAYIWDDHDFGPNDCDSKAPGRLASRLTYQEFMPHYPLGAGAGDVPVYQAFSIGRVRFILTDLRSERSPDSVPDGVEKSMMGARQKAWFKQELRSAQAAGAGLIVWGSSVPLVGAASRTGDGWAAFATERRELADFIKASGITNLVVLCGDAHMTAADDGTNADFASGGGAPLTVLHGSSLDQGSSFKGGPYTHGWYLPRNNEGCFGWVEIEDRGAEIALRFSGRNHRDEEKVRLALTVKCAV
jgi:alkaline phosphatase D